MRFLTVSPKNQGDLQIILASWFPEHIGKNPTAVLYTDGSQTVGTDATLAISFVLPAR